MLYCFGSGREILSVLIVFVMCYDFSYVNDCGVVKVINLIISLIFLFNAIMGSLMMIFIVNLYI